MSVKNLEKTLRQVKDEIDGTTGYMKAISDVLALLFGKKKEPNHV